MTQRYFVETPIAGAHARLLATEAHHLAHVMRAKPGDQVVLFDGRGGEYLAQVERIERSSVELAVLAHQALERELAVPVVVGASLPKGDRQRWLVEKLVELGVSTFVPLATARAVAQPTAGALDRLRRSVIEASKQCGRNRLMHIEEPREWRAFLGYPPPAARRCVGHPGAKHQIAEFLRAAPASSDEGFAVAVGPEGGLTDDEVQQATASGWTAVGLGARILRVETAALVLATAAALAIVKPLVAE